MRKFKGTALLLLSLCFTITALAQTSINIVSFTVKNQLPGDVNTWGMVPASLVLVAQQTDVAGQTIRHPKFKLVLQIKQGNSIICGNNPQTAKGLEAFKVRTFNANELLQSLANCTTLKPGNYTICARFYNEINEPVSREACKEFTVEADKKESRILLTIPANGTTIAQKDIKKPLILRWAAIPPPARGEDALYKVMVFEMREGMSTVQATRGGGQPVFEKTVERQTQLVFQLPADAEGKNYAWMVQKIDREGRGIGENNGMAEQPFTFMIAQEPGMIAIKLVSPTEEQPPTSLRPTFEWTTEKLEEGASFSLVLKEVLEEGDPESGRIVMERKGIRENSLRFPADAPPLDSAKVYVWKVTAVGKDGVTSEASFFRIEGHLGRIDHSKRKTVNLIFTDGTYSWDPVHNRGSQELVCRGSGICFGGSKQRMEKPLRIPKEGDREQLNDREVIGAFTLTGNVLEVERLTRPPEKSKNFNISEDIELNPAICKLLGVKPPVFIKSGDYAIDYSENQYGSIKLKTGVGSGNDTIESAMACTWWFGWSCTFFSGIYCNELGLMNGYSNFGTSYCQDNAVMVSPNSNSGLYVDLSNNAILEVNGNRIKVASDKLELFVKTKMKNNEKPLVNKEFNKEMIDFIKKDNGFVSQSTLEKIAKTFKTKIIKVEKLPTANYCPPCEDDTIKLPGKILTALEGGKDTIPKLNYFICTKPGKRWVCILLSGQCFWENYVSGAIQEGVFCLDAAARIPGHIEVSEKGEAWIVLEKDTTRFPISSDAFEAFHKEQEAKYAKANKDDEKIQEEMEREYIAFSKTDDHKVSSELLAKISEIIGFKIVKGRNTPESTIPPVDVCDCGTWSSLSVQNAEGTQRYECGKEIEAKCNQSFDFRSTYQCKSSDKSCEAKTKWTVTKDGVTIGTGRGLIGSFTPTSNGVYTITLNADCNGKECPPCIYTIVVKDCEPLCDCGTWGSLLVQNAAGSIQYKCGKEIEAKCNKKFDFRSSYQCKPNNATCVAKTKWTVTKDGVTIGTGNGLIGSFTPTANGVYTITLDAECNGIKCPPCTYKVVVNCPPICECGIWGSLLVQNTTGSSIKYECGQEIVGSCNKKFDFRSSYQCKPNNDTCVAKTKWTVTKDGVTIGTGNGLIGSFTPTANGVYTITLNADCNGKECPPCTYSIIVKDCEPLCDGNSTTTVTDTDGNTYQTVTIGTQCWTTKNLEVTTYRDGTPIPQVTDPTAWANLTTGAWCYYNNNSANGTTYGKLYNWYAVAGIYDAASLSNAALRKQLAPAGYHVPTDAEWTTLTTFLGGAAVAGDKMKETGTTHWTSPNTAATNSSGFTGRPGGCRLYNSGTFFYIGVDGYWWSSSENGTANAWFRYLYSNYGPALRYDNKKSLGVSVRCLRD